MPLDKRWLLVPALVVGAALLHLQRLEAHELSYGRRGLLASEDGPQER